MPDRKFRRSAFFAAAVFAAALFASIASAAGGVRVTLLTPAPKTLKVGGTWTLRMEIWRPNRLPPNACYRPDPVHHPQICIHPKSPRLRLCCLRPLVTARDAAGHVDRVVARPIKPYALDGRYRASLTFQSAGTWTVIVDDRHGGTHKVAAISVTE